MILNNNYDDESDEKNIYYYCLKIPQRLLDIKKLKRRN